MIKCLKMINISYKKDKKQIIVLSKRPKTNVISPNVLFDLIKMQRCSVFYQEKHKIFLFKQNVWYFCLKNTYNNYLIIQRVVY